MLGARCRLEGVSQRLEELGCLKPMVSAQAFGERAVDRHGARRGVGIPVGGGQIHDRLVDVFTGTAGAQVVAQTAHHQVVRDRVHGPDAVRPQHGALRDRRLASSQTFSERAGGGATRVSVGAVQKADQSAGGLVGGIARLRVRPSQATAPADCRVKAHVGGDALRASLRSSHALNVSQIPPATGAWPSPLKARETGVLGEALEQYAVGRVERRPGRRCVSPLSLMSPQSRQSTALGRSIEVRCSERDVIVVVER